MATTRRKIREQIQLAYSQYINKNGFNDNIDVRIIDLHVEQSINKFLKVETLNGFKNGNIEVPSCNIVKYTLTPGGNSIQLPVVPLSLPMDMGVWKISLVSDGVAFIPINTAMSSVYQGTSANNLETQVGYTKNGSTIKFTKAVTTPVDVLLLVSDFSVLAEDDLLPVTPEVESTVILDVLQIISSGKISQLEINSASVNEN